MKFRLGLSNKDIAYRFGLPFSTVSKIWRDWVPLLSSVLTRPSKEAVRANLPKSFKPKFKNCRCINNLRAETWSNYKHQNTIKYLIGITPACSISFLSDGWGGQASDIRFKLLKQTWPCRCHTYSYRGFLIREELASVGATLKIPSFTKGKSQFSGPCIDMFRQLSRVCIHVECVIGQLKNFQILKSVIPIS